MRSACRVPSLISQAGATKPLRGQSIRWNTSIPALDMGGAFPGGLTLVNRGFIMGKGGDGGYTLADRTTYVAPTPGGPAIALRGPISIDNSSGYIGGGGGGGAGLASGSARPAVASARAAGPDHKVSFTPTGEEFFVDHLPFVGRN